MFVPFKHHNSKNNTNPFVRSAPFIKEKVTQDMKWKHRYNKLGLSRQITSASYSLKTAYKKHLFPFEEHQKTNNVKETEPVVEDDAVSPPAVKTHDQQQSDDEEHGSTTSIKSPNVDQGSDQCIGPSNHDDGHASAQDVTEDNAMDTTDNDNDTNNSEQKCSAPSTYTVGEKTKVWYGKGKFLKPYVAKIMDSTMESGMREYLVHYSSWNARYDEWISEDRVATRLAVCSNGPSTAKKKQSPKNRRGRPPQTFGPPEESHHSTAQHSKPIKQPSQQKTANTAQRDPPVKSYATTGREGSKPANTCTYW